MTDKNKKQAKETFEVTATAQWDKNRQRFLFIQNAILELAKVFGLSIDKDNGTFVSFKQEDGRWQLPQSSSPNTPVIQQPTIDTESLSKDIAEKVSNELHTYFQQNPIKSETVQATVDDSVHIANNKALMDRLEQDWLKGVDGMCKLANILKDIKDDGSIIYKIDKEGRKKRLVDKDEKARLEFEKKPWVIKVLLTQVNTLKKAVVFYVMAVIILVMTLWNITLHQENRELELTTKEYLILRWHVNTKPESKAFMEQLDSFVKAEGISPVYDRVVEGIHTSKEQQTHKSNK